MALQHLQAVLARLYLDSAYRERFFADREAALRDEPLAEEERRQLLALDHRQVERFSRSLQSKRRDAVREFVPATANALGDAYRPRFAAYADAHLSTPEPLPDALQFAGYVAAQPDLPLWPRELARLERLRLEILNAAYAPGLTPEAWTHRTLSLTSWARVERFRYDLAASYPAARTGEIAAPPETECWLLIGKSGPLQVRQQRVNEATARVLLMCDGTRAANDLLREAGAVLRLSEPQRQEFAREARELLTGLLQAGLIAAV